jgi:hypothetical protein
MSDSRYTVAAALPAGCSVQRKGDPLPILNHAPYAVACAVARHLNGQSPEAGDVEALVCFSLGYCGELP